MKITKRQIRRIIKEERHRLLSEAGKPPLTGESNVISDLESTVLQMFFATGQVTTADVFDRLRMDGHSDKDINWAIEVSR
jgi:hypothetical protein